MSSPSQPDEASSSDPARPELPDSLFPSRYGARVAADKPRGHRQGTNPAMMHCPACREGNCVKCPDRIFLILRKEPVCTCKRAGHDDAISGEPRTNQVQDPFTGDIHGPAAIVRSETGEVEYPSSAD